jgi:hypothetical protein
MKAITWAKVLSIILLIGTGIELGLEIYNFEGYSDTVYAFLVAVVVTILSFNFKGATSKK